MPRFLIKGARGLNFKKCYPQEALDETNVLFDLNYFKYCFLKATGIDFHELKLEAAFRLVAQDIVAIPGEAFMYRDFQARNVMLDKDGNPYFIDFQGGRRGPVQYDVASFLWQASARYSKSLREELIKTYINNLKQYIEVNEKQFRQNLKLCVLFRLLQVLGAYGFRGYFERKNHFLESIPAAIQNLRDLLQDGGCPYPYLREVLTRLIIPMYHAQKMVRLRSVGMMAKVLWWYVFSVSPSKKEFQKIPAAMAEDMCLIAEARIILVVMSLTNNLQV